MGARDRLLLCRLGYSEGECQRRPAQRSFQGTPTMASTVCAEHSGGLTSGVSQALWRYSRAAVRLHLMYLSNAERAAESHSILVREIPGTSAGGTT